MPNSISSLPLRNLSDVFSENDPTRRRGASDEIFREDAVFYDPQGGIFRGRDEIDRSAGVIKATHPDFEYQPNFPFEELGDAARVRWVSGAAANHPPARERILSSPATVALLPFIFFPIISLKAKMRPSAEARGDEWAVRLLETVASQMGYISATQCQ